MLKKVICSIICCFALVFAAFGSECFAVSYGGNPRVDGPNGTVTVPIEDPDVGGDEFKKKANEILGTVLSIIFFAVGSISIVIIVWAGISYSMAAGDPGKINKAKAAIIAAIIGIIIAALSGTIAVFVTNKVAG